MSEKSMIEKVKDFHLAFSHYVSYSPTLEPVLCDDPEQLKNLRIKLIDEEFDELKKALSENDVVEVADALGDILYVTFGAALVYGLPIEEIFNEIHESNMTKLGEDGKPLLNGVNCPLDESRPYGKVIKGPNYRKPNIKAIIEKYL